MPKIIGEILTYLAAAVLFVILMLATGSDLSGDLLATAVCMVLGLSAALALRTLGNRRKHKRTD